ncbi:MAG TPA: hydrophobic protein [Candidatus Dormibacteraeota bacterium]|nr:hydrophobic protein [Candidatus Dormibacteraeota bacterium]
MILVLLGAGGMALHILWYVLVAALILWAIGFLFSSAEGRWYRW